MNERSGSKPALEDGGQGQTLASRLLRWATPATMIPLTVAIIGVLGQQALKVREERLTQRAMIEQKSRLFVELMSRREESESSLRKDMFRAILGEFFKDIEQGDEIRAMSKRLLKLEMLALNFGESLSLSPMFRELERDLDSYEPQEGEEWIFDKMIYSVRLRTLAKRVANWQMTSLEQPGAFFDFKVEFQEAERGVSADCLLELEGIFRSVRITLTEPRLEEQTVRAAVVLSRHEDPTETGGIGVCTRVDASDGDASADFEFELSWFDFPMIDNTRLDRDHRFALTLTKLHPEEVAVSGAIFPGLYGSQRNKPFLDIVLEQLPDLLAQSDSGQDSELENE